MTSASKDITDPSCGSAAFIGNGLPPGYDGDTVLMLLRKLYSAAYQVEEGLQRECDHATYEGNTEAVDDLREILGQLEAEFPSLVYSPSDDEGDE